MGAYQLVDLQGFGLSSGDPYSYSYEAKIVDCSSTGAVDELTDYEGMFRTNQFGAGRSQAGHLVAGVSDFVLPFVSGSYATWQAMKVWTRPTSTTAYTISVSVGVDSIQNNQAQTEHFGDVGFGGIKAFGRLGGGTPSADAKFRNFRLMKGAQVTVKETGTADMAGFRITRNAGEFPNAVVSVSGTSTSLSAGSTLRWPIHKIEVDLPGGGFTPVATLDVSTGIWGGSVYNFTTSTTSTSGYALSLATQGLIHRDQFSGVALGPGWSYSGSPDVSGGVLSLSSNEFAIYTATNARQEMLVQCEVYYQDANANRPGVIARAQGPGLSTAQCRSAVYLDYLDANSSLISTTTSSGVSGLSYLKLCVPSTIPANARYAKFYPVKTGPGNCQPFVRNVFANYGPTCCATPGLGTPLPGVPSQSSALTGAQLVVGTAGACTSTSPGMDVTVSWQYSTALSTAASKLVGITFFEEKDPAGTPGSYFPVHSTGGLSLNANSTLTGNGLHTVHFGVGSNDVSTGGRGTGSTDDQSRKWYAFVQVTQFGITLGNVTSNVFQSPSSYGFCT